MRTRALTARCIKILRRTSLNSLKKLQLVKKCLFSRIHGYKVQENEINTFYNLYIRALKSTYENTAKHIDSFVSKISMEKNSKKSQLQSFLQQSAYTPLPQPQFLQNSPEIKSNISLKKSFSLIRT